MFEVRKNLQLLLSLIASLSGISLIYFASITSVPKEIPMEKLTDEYLGNTITVSGEITKVLRHEAGHVFVYLKSGKQQIQVPIFSSLATNLDENLLGGLREGRKLSVSGTFGEYKGSLQIIPRKPSDLVIS